MTLKVFLSHNHEDYELAKEIELFLEDFGLEVFVAHKDIKPSREWVEVLDQKIKECDIFMPLLTKNFYKSEWTDQESGIAYTHQKTILSIKIDENPRGFINKYQALYFDNSTEENQRKRELMKIFDRIITDFPEQIKESLINSLERPHTSTYKTASKKIKMLNGMQPFNKTEINIIMNKSSENDQIYDNGHLKPILKNWFTKYDKEISSEIKEKIKEVLYPEEFASKEETAPAEKKSSLVDGLPKHL